MDGRALLSVALAASSLTAVPGAAQPPPAGQASTPTPTAAGFPVARAWRVEQGPRIDGEVLGEAVWATATPQTGFRQNTPDEGEPASERTEVRIVYTDEAIYFGVVCFVRDPATVIVSDARRDSSRHCQGSMVRSQDAGAGPGCARLGCLGNQTRRVTVRTGREHLLPRPGREAIATTSRRPVRRQRWMRLEGRRAF